MIIRTINGDDEINKLCNQAMNATIYAMIREGLITEDQGGKFYETHICQVLDETVFERFYRRMFGAEAKGARCIVTKGPTDD